MLLLIWEGYASSAQAQTQEYIWSETYEFRSNVGALKRLGGASNTQKKGADHKANTLSKNHVESLGTTATRKGEATTQEKQQGARRLRNHIQCERDQ